MKRFILILMTCFCAITSWAYAAEINFVPRSGGKYIYCNNREFIYRQDVADVSNENPKFIMSNEGMGPDKYTLFASHVNHTEVKDSYGVISGKGFDVELDVMFRALEDTTVKITAIGFEVPENIKYYINGEEFTTEKDWGCFTAWASYLGCEISELDSGKKYKPVKFDGAEFTVKAGEVVYLSEYIPGYRAVPVWRPVHLMADFEIVEGLCDVNVFASKTLGNTPGNRKNLSRNILFGSFVPQYEMKGIANSQNHVDANVELTIPSNAYAGMKLPVTVYNRYAKEGNTVTTWYTNLNPTSDIWNKNNVAEDCMLSFEYKDPSKKNYYGKAVKESEKDDVWVFDTNHALIWEHKPDLKVKKSNFIPNFELVDYIPEEYCNSLGNYGVFQNYNLTITNEGYSDKWVNYTLNTGASNLIILKDESGRIVSGYPLTKGTVGRKESDILASIKVPARETVKYTLSVILTTNYPGGMENSFVIADMPAPINTYSPDLVLNVKDCEFTGKEYIRFDEDVLYTSQDLVEWTGHQLSQKVKEIFRTSSEIKVTWTGDCYILNNCQHSGVPYYSVRDYYRDVWFLDENFNLINQDTFEIYPTDSSGALGIYYIKAGSNYYSKDGNNWDLLGGGMNLPCYNYGRFAASFRNGKVCLSENGTNFYDVLYEGKKPLYIDSLGDVYYYVDGRSIYVSPDGLYWKSVEAPCNIETVGRAGGDIIVNREIILSMPDLNFENAVVNVFDKYYSFNEPLELINGEVYVPLRAFASVSDGDIVWDSASNTASIKVFGKEISFTLGEQLPDLQGKVMIKDGKMIVPLKMLKSKETEPNL